MIEKLVISFCVAFLRMHDVNVIRIQRSNGISISRALSLSCETREDVGLNLSATDVDVKKVFSSLYPGPYSILRPLQLSAFLFKIPTRARNSVGSRCDGTHRSLVEEKYDAAR